MIRTYQGTAPRVANSAYIDPSAQVIGDVIIGERSSVWPNVSIRGDVNHIRVGDETSIQDNSVLHVDHVIYPCIIGNRVTVGHGVVLHGCVVEDGALIGIGAILRLPDLDQAKSAALNSLTSADAQRGYRHAIDGVGGMVLF